MLPSTSVPIKAIDITSKEKVTNLDIPECQSLTIKALGDVRLMGVNLDIKTTITAPNSMVTKCNSVMSLNFGNCWSESTIVGMSTLIHVEGGDINIIDCPNVESVDAEGYITSDSVLSLKEVRVCNVEGCNDLVRISINNAKSVYVFGDGFKDLNINPETIESIEVVENEEPVGTILNDLIQRSTVLTSIETMDELDIDIVEKWLEQGDKDAIISKNDYNEIWKEYPTVAFCGSTMSKELVYNNKLLRIRNKTLYDLVKY